MKACLPRCLRKVNSMYSNGKRTCSLFMTRRLSTVAAAYQIASAKVEKQTLSVLLNNVERRIPAAYMWDHKRHSTTSPKTAPSLAPLVRWDPTQVTVNWSTGDQSEISAEWLAKHFAIADKQSQRFPSSDGKIYWGSDYVSKIPTFDFQTLLKNDRHLLELFDQLESHGILLVSGAKAESGQLRLLDARFGWLRYTINHAGYSNLMNVKTVENPTTLANTGRRLHLHVDFPFVTYTTSFRCLHCIQQVPRPRAGAGWYCDGFAVADHLRKEDPRTFDILSSHPIEFADSAQREHVQFNTKSWHPMLKLDEDKKQVEGVYISNHAQSSRYMARLKPSLFEWYAAYYQYTRLLHDPRFVIEVKLEPGQILVFENTRVLHGRPEFEARKGEVRHLESICFDRDAVYAKKRALLAKKAA